MDYSLLFNILNQITDDEKKNRKILKKYKKQILNSKSIFKKMILHSHEINKVYSVKACLEIGKKIDEENDNPVYIALENFINEEITLNILELCLQYGLDVNKTYQSKPPLLAYMIINSWFTDNILNIYELLKDNGYNIFLTYNNYKSIEYLMNNSNKYKDKDEFLRIIKKDKEEILNNMVITKEELISKYLKDKKILNMNTVLEDIFYKVIEDKVDEDYKLKIIKYLLENGMDINLVSKNVDDIILYIISYTKSNFNFIYNILNLFIDYGFDINHTNVYNRTILHVLISSKDYTDRIIPIYELLMEKGYNDQKQDNAFDTIYQLAARKENEFIDKEEFIYKYCLIQNRSKFCNTEYIKDEDKDYLNRFGNFIKYDDKEIETYYNFDLRNPHNKDEIGKLYYSDLKKIILLTGKEGIGLNDALNYSIQQEYINYNTVIYHATVDNIINNCKNIASLNSTINNILRKCAYYKIMVIIYDIDKIYINCLDKEDKEEIDNYIEYLVESKDLILRGTIKENKRDVFYNSNLKYLIEYVYIHEPEDNEIQYILPYELDEYNLNVNDDIFDLLTEIIIICNRLENRLNYENISIRKIIKDMIYYINEYLNNNNINNIDINSILYALNNLDNVKVETKNIIINDLKNNNKLNNNKVKKLTK